MAAIIHGVGVTFGALSKPVELSYSGFPPFEKLRLRFRNDDFARAFTKHSDGSIKHWYIKVSDTGVVSPAMEAHGFNLTADIRERFDTRERSRRLIRKPDANLCK